LIQNEILTIFNTEFQVSAVQQTAIAHTGQTILCS